MPKQRKRTKHTGVAAGRSPSLHRIEGLVLEGGIRPLGMRMQDGPATFQPSLILWIEADTGMVRATDQINPLETSDGGISEALDALTVAFTGPFPGFEDLGTTSRRSGIPVPPGIPVPRAGLPELVRVSEARLAEAARGVLAPLGVRVELVREMPAFDEIYESFAAMIGANPTGELPGPFDWVIDPALVGPLFAAAARFAKLAPWQYMLDNPPVAVNLGEAGPAPEITTLYASVLGAGGEVFGTCLYYSLDGLREHMRVGALMQMEEPQIDQAVESLRHLGVPLDDLPQDALREMMSGIMESGLGEEDQPLGVDSLICSFAPVEECDPTYLEWLRARGVPIPNRGLFPMLFRNAAEDEEPRDLTDAETRAFTLALEALSAFFAKFGLGLWDPEHLGETRELSSKIRLGTETVPVDLVFPAPGFDELDDDPALSLPILDEEAGELAAASPAEAATLFRFQVKLQWRPTTWRRIEMSGDQTLHDLHQAIQSAFDWDDDHLYSFFLSGKAWDSKTEYTRVPANENERRASEFRLAWLPLKPRQQFLYLFDFGDDLRHLVKVEAIVQGGVEAGVMYPRITEREGENEPQYDIEEDEDEEE
ncbi:MAG TPA: plasmid pRiA4b ORF-3 family protein [Chloroflexota bacterium]|nr:plasmid pRiA4b ORF-3 family protein [Chloroflexota bacterium]